MAAGGVDRRLPALPLLGQLRRDAHLPRFLAAVDGVPDVRGTWR